MLLPKAIAATVCRLTYPAHQSLVVSNLIGQRASHGTITPKPLTQQKSCHFMLWWPERLAYQRAREERTFHLPLPCVNRSLPEPARHVPDKDLT